MRWMDDGLMLQLLLGLRGSGTKGAVAVSGSCIAGSGYAVDASDVGLAMRLVAVAMAMMDVMLYAVHTASISPEVR